MLKFVVLGSSGDRYEVDARREGDHFHMSCTCEAGRHGTYCKHRFALLDGDIKNLASGNPADVEALRKLIGGTDVDRRYRLVCELAAERNRIEARLREEKKALAQEMNG